MALLNASVKSLASATASKPAPRLRALSCVFAFAPFLLAGCITGRQNPAATQPATAIDPKSAQPDYWLNKPAVTDVASRSFDRLWEASRASLVSRGFLIDRTDYRDGVLTSLPLISKQFYEVWRDDVVTIHDLEQSSLSSMRRTVRIDIRRMPDGSFQATPRVVVDRFSLLSKRITSVDQYRTVFSLTTTDLRLSAEEEGVDIPAQYWYPVARDYALERHLAGDISDRLK